MNASKVFAPARRWPSSAFARLKAQRLSEATTCPRHWIFTKERATARRSYALPNPGEYHV